MLQNGQGGLMKIIIKFTIKTFALLNKHGEELKEKYTKKLVGYPYNKEGLFDLWFLSGSEAMNQFSQLYLHLDEYNKRKNCPEMILVLYQITDLLCTT